MVRSIYRLTLNGGVGLTRSVFTTKGVRCVWKIFNLKRIYKTVFL